MFLRKGRANAKLRRACHLPGNVLPSKARALGIRKEEAKKRVVLKAITLMVSCIKFIFI